MSLGHRTKNYTSPTYHSWAAMKNRCQSKTSKDYPRWGGKGITVCQEWQKFENFLRDMREKPAQGWSIDRIDNNKGYEPSNCRWATPSQQQANRKVAKLLTHLGRTQTEGAWAKEYGISRGRLRYRLEQGMSMESALMKETLGTGLSSSRLK